MAVAGGILARDMMFQLPFDIAQQRRRAKAEQIGLQPAIAQFVFDQRQIDQRVLGLGYAARGFVADAMPVRS